LSLTILSLSVCIIRLALDNSILMFLSVTVELAHEHSIIGRIIVTVVNNFLVIIGDIYSFPVKSKEKNTCYKN